MIEILIIILVVRMFSRTAGEKGLNKTLWGFIGAASYYIPILITSFLVLRPMVESGQLTFNSYGAAVATMVAINLAVGILCCVIAYQILKRTGSVDKDQTIDNNIN